MSDDRVKRARGRGVAVSVLGALLLAGCSTAPDPPPGHGEPLDNVRLHALMTDRIATLSDQLNALTFEQHRTESDLEELRGQRSAEVAAAAMRLQQSALRIAGTPPPVTGPLASGERFSALARQLAEGAGELAQLAQVERVNRFQPAIERINATCYACHGLYRDR